MDKVMKHMDCRNYVALDVAKGICHRAKELVLADADRCEHCVPVPRCKFCAHFVSGDEYLGACSAVSNRPMTYPDLITVTCAKFLAAGAERA